MRGDSDDGHGGPRVEDIEAAATFHKRLFAERHLGPSVNTIEFANLAQKLGWELPRQFAQLATLQSDDNAPEPASNGSSRITALPNGIEGASAEAATKTKAGPCGAIEKETRSHVDTACAAFWLNRKEQTLRTWASRENGRIRPGPTISGAYLVKVNT